MFDLSYNTGGSINLALFIVYLLFPDFEPSFDIDMVVTKLSHELIIQATSNSRIKDSIDLSKIPPPQLNLTREAFMKWAAVAAFSVTSTSIFDAFL